MKPVRQCGGSARSERHRKSWSSSSADGALNETTWHRRGGSPYMTCCRVPSWPAAPASGGRAAPPTDRDRAADPAGGRADRRRAAAAHRRPDSLTGIGIGWARLETGADIAVDDAMPPPLRQSDEGPTPWRARRRRSVRRQRRRRGPSSRVGARVDASEGHPLTAAAKRSTASTYRARRRVIVRDQPGSDDGCRHTEQRQRDDHCDERYRRSASSGYRTKGLGGPAHERGQMRA